MGSDRKASSIFITLFVLTYSCSSVFSQEKPFDSVLANKIDSIFKKDQLFRIVISPVYPKQKLDSIERVYSLHGQKLRDSLGILQRDIDYSNYKFIDSLIKEKGYPGKSIVGAQKMDYAAIVLLHNPYPNKHIGLLKEAVRKKELNPSVFALIIDRDLVNQNKKQYYGTQVIMLHGKSYLWPIKKPKHINNRRQEVGLGKIESYLKLFDIDYSSQTRSKHYLNKEAKKNSFKK